jgi:hypothetical protein
MTDSHSIVDQPTQRFSPAAVAGCLVLLWSLSVHPPHAQQSAPDVIRGTVTDDSWHAVVAKVMITRGPDRLTQEASTDSARDS